MYSVHVIIHVIHDRPSTTRSTRLPVMCGATAVSCMRYGVSDTNHLRLIVMQRLEHTHAVLKMRLVAIISKSGL